MNSTAWLQVIGDAYVALAFDLSTFITDDSLVTLEKLRGQDFFDTHLEGLPEIICQGPFKLADEYLQREEHGYGMGIFNHILAQNNFSPTYRVIKEKIIFPAHLLDNVQFKDRFLPIWKRWNFYLRLSSNGIVTIILHLNIPKYRELELVAQDVMGLHYYFDKVSALEKLSQLQIDMEKAKIPQDANIYLAKIKSVKQLLEWVDERSMNHLDDDQSPIVWQMAVDVMRNFAQTAGLTLVDKNEGWQLNLMLSPRLGGIRETFTIYLLKSIRDRKDPSTFSSGITANQVAESPIYKNVISSLIEGSLLRGQTTYSFPIHNLLTVEQIFENNLATWDNELCLISDKTAFIYYRIPPDQRIAFSSREIEYQEYWLTILRLLEFGLEVKLLSLFLEAYTSKTLSFRLSDRWKREHKSSPQYSAESVSSELMNISRLLAHTLNLSSAPIVGQANYAIKKYEYLLGSMGISEILGHAETNFNNLSRLLERSNDLNIQMEGQTINEIALAFSLFFASVTLSMGVLTFPSFIADWQSKSPFLLHLWFYDYLGVIGIAILFVLIMTSLLAFGFAIWMFGRLRKKRYYLW